MWGFSLLKLSLVTGLFLYKNQNSVIVHICQDTMNTFSKSHVPLLKTSSSWWLLLSWCAQVTCGQSDCWPFLASFPASTSCFLQILSISSRNSVSTSNYSPQSLVSSSAKLITSTFSLEDIFASLVIPAWNRSATALLETKPCGRWMMAWQIIRTGEQKKSGDSKQPRAGVTDKN